MNTAIIIKQNVTPAQAQQVLAASGLTVSEKEAKAIVDFLYILASSNKHK